MKRLYLSGPMSDFPDNNYPAFNAAAAALRAAGYHVENPAENPSQESWAAYMRVALTQMLTCDEVFLLPGWEQSSGAVWEASIARGLGMQIRTIDGGISFHQVGRHLVHLPAPGALRRAQPCA
jgi:hypothetical protein